MVAARNRIRELEEGCGGLTKDRSELQATVAKQNRELEDGRAWSKPRSRRPKRPSASIQQSTVVHHSAHGISNIP
eukprot:6874519-Pyramimonas_sp.AAC.1